ncbi:hypothetical protein LBMAG27_17980 [Bacteroidota bacterium]|nr:hypothetical protein LBMAG27_17980 [Bacteroidota bacterium]
MKKILFFLIASLFFTAFNTYSQNWTAVSPAFFPTNMSGQIHGISRVSEMRYHPTDSLKMYAVSARGGLFLSSDQGSNWTVAAGTDVMGPSKRFSAVCIDPVNDQIIYLGIGDENYYSSGQGIYKSINGGTTFSATTLSGKIVVDILIDPLNHNTIVAATNTGIYKSMDAGATWILKSVSISSREMVMKPKATSRVLYLASVSAFYRSTDFGETWNQISSGITTASGGCRLGVTPSDTQTVYFVSNVAYGTIYKSTDGGSNFIMQKTGDAVSNLNGYNNVVGDVGQGNYNTGFCVDRLNPNIVYFVAHNVWKSINGGVTWTQLTNWWANVHTDMHQVFTSPYNNNKLWNINDGGVWLSTDGGTNWTQKSNGIYGYEIYKGNCSPTRRDMISIGTQDNGELYSTSAGWFTNRGGDWGSECAFDNRANSSMVYYFGNGKRRFVTSSENIFSASAVINSIAFSKSNLNSAFFSDTFIYRTNNLLSGAPPTWTQLTNTKKTYKHIYYPPSDSNRLYVITADGFLFKSVNAQSPVPTFTIIALPFTTNNAAKITGLSDDANKLYAIMNTRVYYSTDGGASWTNVTYNLPSVNHVNVITDYYYPQQNIVYVATPNAVYYKKGAATSWTLMSNGIPGFPTIVNLSDYDDGTANSLLRIATYGRGMWEAPISFNRDFDAQITSTDSLDCATGKIFHFHDASNGTVISRTWSFPGGTPSSSTSANPNVIYSAPGNYGVTLIAFNGLIYDTLTIVNYVSYVNECGLDTVPGKAMSFSGTASYVTVPALPINSNTVTISAWVKISALQPDYSGIFITDGTPNGFNFKVNGNTNYIGCHWNGTSIWSNTSTDSVPRYKWTHVALVVSPTNAKLYVNGKATTITTTMAVVNFNLLTAKIGRYLTWTNRNMNNAMIDEVCVYNRSLTQNEIRDLMHLTKKPSSDPTLILYYQFNELNSTNFVYDKTGHNLHSAIFNSFRSTSTGPFAGGSSARLTVNSAGNYSFIGTNLTLTFAAGTYPNGDLVVSRLNIHPDQLPNNTSFPTSRSYWVINNYGTNSVFSPLSSISFDKIGDVPVTTGTNNLKLYKRNSFVDGNTWGAYVSSSSSITIGSDGGVVYNNPGITSFSMFDIVNEGSSLPITWVSFEVTKINEGKSGLLNWKVIGDDLTDYFEIERSADALHFEKLATVPSTENPEPFTIEYKFEDSNPVNGDNYYRIKEFDKDGSFYFSLIRSLNFSYIYENHVKIYPNPVGEMQQINFENDWGSDMNVIIYDVTGRYLTNEIISNRKSFKVKLLSGFYLYTIQMDGRIVNGKLAVE